MVLSMAVITTECQTINPLNAELNPICHLLALLEAHPIFHVSSIRVNNEMQREGKRLRWSKGSVLAFGTTPSKPSDF